MISPPNNTFELSRVNDLIDSLKCEWQTDLVRKVFLHPNVESILSVPLCSCLPQDRLVWAYTPKGKFTVCSVYKIALEMAMNSGVGEPLIGHTRRKFWRNIWSLNTSNKVKSFAWRACQNILPTKANLCRMYVKFVDWV